MTFWTGPEDIEVKLRDCPLPQGSKNAQCLVCAVKPIDIGSGKVENSFTPSWILDLALGV